MNMIPIICHQCFNKFEIPTKEYTRQIKNGREYFFCSRSCSASQTTHKGIKSNCLFCHKEFNTTTHRKAKKCCSLDCAVKYAQSFVNTEQISKSLIEYNKLYPRPKPYPAPKTFTCVICQSIFTKNVKHKTETYKTCSNECFRKLMQKNSRANPNCGGDTNYKKYKYGGVWMDSKWEVELASWMDNRDIKWERSRKLHQFMWTDKDGNKRRYYPDFYLPYYNVYLDPKNKYLIEVDKYKINSVIKENRIRLFWGLLENVKKELDILMQV